MKLSLSILKGYFFKSKFLSLLFILTALSIGIIYSSLAIYLNFLETNVLTKTLNSLGASNKNIWLLNTNVSLSEDYLDAQSGLIEELVEEESGLIKNNSKILKLNLSKKSLFKNIVKKNNYQYSSIADYHFSILSIDNLFENVSILTSTDENKEGVFNISISENTSKKLDVLVGDIIYLTDPLYPEPLRFHVSKIFQLDKNDEFWMGQTSVVNPQTNFAGFQEEG